MPSLPPITRTLILVCVAFFALQVLMPPTLELWLALWPVNSGRFMPWQVVSYSVLHGDFWHLLLNMLGLWMFGSDLERLWGPRRYVQYVAASVLSAAAVQIAWTYLIGTNVPTVGASGAIFGLLLAYGMTFPNRTVMLLIPPIPMKAKYFVMIYAVIELFFGVSGRGDIAHFAHLGGMLGGLVLILYWRGRGPFNRMK